MKKYVIGIVGLGMIGNSTAVLRKGTSRATKGICAAWQSTRKFLA